MKQFVRLRNCAIAIVVGKQIIQKKKKVYNMNIFMMSINV